MSSLTGLPPASGAPPSTVAVRARWRGRPAFAPVAVLVLTLVLCGCSLVVGVGDLDARALLSGDLTAAERELLVTSRLPRTLALVLCGAALAVSGLVMQLLTRNPFVEPATAGTMEFAGLGLLVALLLAPDASLTLKMVCGTAAALVGTAVFVAILGRVPQSDILSVPLLGIMLGTVVSAFTAFIAYQTDLMQSLGAWLTGDFSAVLQGRYELLWAAGAVTVLVLALADRFTVAGLGSDVATNLGLDHRRVLVLGLALAAVVTSTVVVTVGMLPFIGLVVPNLVTRVLGGNARRSVPWAAVLGAALVLACDLVARLIRHPYEIPIGTVTGVLGGLAFLALLLGSRRVR